MTQEELNHIRRSCSFLARVQVRLPITGETIVFDRMGEVAFYETAFSTGLHFSFHPILRIILNSYNTCFAHLVSNGWRSMIGGLLLWQSDGNPLSLIEFRNSFNLFNNPKPDLGWWYFKAKPCLTLIGDYPSNIKGWKKFFFILGDD